MNNNKIKPFYNVERVTLGKVLPLDTPFTVIIDTSEICNFKCNYCFRAHSEIANETYVKKEGLMKWATFIKVVEQIKQFPKQVKRISLSGHGEPMCNKLLPDMVRYIKENGLLGKTEIHTNASMLMNNKFACDLADSGIDKVIISLQGLNAHTYNKVSNVSINYDEFYNGIKTFYKRKINTEVNIKIANVALRDGEKDLFFQKFDEVSDKLYVEKIVPLFNGIDYTDIIKKHNKGSNKYGVTFGNLKCCNVIYYTLFITPEGIINPCTQLEPPFILGNIYDTTLLEAWNSKSRINFLRQDLTVGHRINKKCKDCYIPYNTVKVEEDLIDNYSNDILARLDNNI